MITEDINAVMLKIKSGEISNGEISGLFAKYAMDDLVDEYIKLKGVNRSARILGRYIFTECARLGNKECLGRIKYYWETGTNAECKPSVAGPK